MNTHDSHAGSGRATSAGVTEITSTSATGVALDAIMKARMKGSRRSGRAKRSEAEANMDRSQPRTAVPARQSRDSHALPKKARPTFTVREMLSTPAAVHGKDASGAGWGKVMIVRYNESVGTYVVRRLDAGDESDADSEWESDDARFKGAVKLSTADVASAKGSGAGARGAQDEESGYPILAPESRGATLVGFNLLADGRAVTITAYSMKPTAYTVVDDATKTVTVLNRGAEVWLRACRLIAMPVDGAKRIQFRDYTCLGEASVVQAIIREKIRSGAYIATTSGGKTRSLLSASDALDDPSYGRRLAAARSAASTPTILHRAATSCVPPALRKCGKSCQNQKGGKGYEKIVRAAKTSDAAILRKRTRAQCRKLGAAQREWDAAVHTNRGRAKGKRPTAAMFPVLAARPRPPAKEGCPGNRCKAFFKPERPAQASKTAKCYAKCWCDTCNNTDVYPRGCVYVMTGSLLVYEAKFSTPEGGAACVVRHAVQAAVRGPVVPMLRASKAIAKALKRVGIDKVDMPTLEDGFLLSQRKRKRSSDQSLSATPDVFAAVGAALAAGENPLYRAHSLTLPLEPHTGGLRRHSNGVRALMAHEMGKAEAAEEELPMTQELDQGGEEKVEGAVQRAVTIPRWSPAESMQHVQDLVDAMEASETLLEVARRAAALLPPLAAAAAKAAASNRTVFAVKAPPRLERAEAARMPLSLES